MGVHTQPVARELYLGYEHPLRKNRLVLCKLPWCNINTGAAVASSKWRGLIKVVAQAVLGQKLFAYFWMHTVL